MANRIDQFETMLSSIQEQHRSVSVKMDILRQSGKEKSATFRQLMGDKLLLSQMLARYKAYGLLDQESTTDGT